MSDSIKKFQELVGNLPTDSQERKRIPIYTGLIKYFPDAIAEVARVSLIGNQQHHPDKPLHWDRSKSTDELDALARHLNENEIPCGVYYPIPLHNQKAYQDSRYNDADFSVTNQLCKEVISLPMHTELGDEQIEYITSKIIAFVNG